ncbi:MAG: hypothetical protein Q7V20_16765 [Aquabacterium sp.]|uniref:hypothetical protein n=1 Tax=Aquabacterium sp. TaxID=1872578 RepID=UPI00271E825C|nr:hypothetical protein [Aquabacterium sp.]MDO9005098.1 hypothetical protein [Aquabacterium sp.]
MKIFSDPVNAVYRALSSKYAGITLGGLMKNAQAIEDEIKDIVYAGILNYFSEFSSFRMAGNHEFFFNGQLYLISFQNLSTEPRLEICILDVRKSAINLCSTGVKEFNGAGFYSGFELQTASALKHHVEPIADAVQKIYKAAYAWLETEMFRLIKEVEKGFVGALYQYLQTILQPEGKADLAKDIWFSVFSDKVGFYALDGKSLDKILSILKERKYRSEKSPATHLLGLIGLEMPSKKSLSMNAITRNEYCEYSLLKAAYVSDMSDIFKTEEQMTKGGAYAICPLGSVGDQQLVAAFPSTLKSVLKPIFEKNEPNFREVYKKEAKALLKHVKHIQASYRRVDSAEYAGIVGNLAGSFFKQYFS